MEKTDFALSATKVSQLLYQHALKFTKDEDDAKDLVQDTVVKGVRFCHRFDATTNIKSWLYVIMRNTFINNYRKIKKARNITSLDEGLTDNMLMGTSVVNLSNSSFAIGDIQKALSSLSKEYAIPFQRYFEGYKYAEIAVELDIPLGTVKTRIHEARIQLKKFLKTYKTN